LSQSSSSDSTTPAVSLGDDNEDDCFGILPPVATHFLTHILINFQIKNRKK
jgi:hypothetical protein